MVIHHHRTLYQGQAGQRLSEKVRWVILGERRWVTSRKRRSRGLSLPMEGASPSQPLPNHPRITTQDQRSLCTSVQAVAPPQNIVSKRIRW